MKRTFLIQHIMLAIIFMAFLSYGKTIQRISTGSMTDSSTAQKKADGSTTEKQAASSGATDQQVKFTVRASQINEGSWSQTSLKAEAGQWVVIQVMNIEDFKNTTDKGGKIQFRTQGGNSPSCSVSFGRTAKAGQIRKTAFCVSSGGRVQYATQGKFSIDVAMTLSDTQPDGVMTDGDESGSGGTSTDGGGTLICPQCHGSGVYTVLLNIPGSRKRGMTDRSPCALCNGTGRCGQSQVDFYRKSVIWAHRNTP